MKKYFTFSLIFTLFHFTFFFLFLSVFRPIPSVDVPENYFWGMNFEWGYYKHPPLFAWVQEIFGKIFGINVQTSYLTAQFFIFIALISTFFLAKEFIGAKKAFFVILLLESLSFAGINARTFNANLVQIPFWVLSSLFYFYAIKYQKLIYFCLFGFFLGLAFLGKYFTLLLGFVIFISFISNLETRKLLKTPLPYFTILTFFLAILPHLIWVIKSGFPALQYIISSQESGCSFLKCRLKYGVSFFVLSIASIIPVFISFFVLFKNFKFKGLNLKNIEGNFLFCISVLPFLITSIVSIITGMFIVVKWSAPFFFFLPIFIFYFWEMEKRNHFKKRVSILITLLFIVWGIVIIISGKKDIKEKGDYYYLLSQISAKHTELWENEFGRKLKIVAGNTFDAGIFAMFSKERPQVLPFNNLDFAHYITQKMLKSEGYILLETCELNQDCSKNEIGDLKEVRLAKVKGKTFYIQIIYIKPESNI